MLRVISLLSGLLRAPCSFVHTSDGAHPTAIEQKGVQRRHRLRRSHRDALYCLCTDPRASSDRPSPAAHPAFSSRSHGRSAALPDAALCLTLPVRGLRMHCPSPGNVRWRLLARQRKS
ncbi:hypothetical protein C8Q77DRAFT_700150 [Trametes polyzona]|nr:hypothetical protein C8Q77DRAFT_700150 [Trametes polyzona]